MNDAEGCNVGSTSFRAPLIVALEAFAVGAWVGCRFGHTGRLGSDLLLAGAFCLLAVLLAVWSVNGILAGPTRRVRDFGWAALGSYGVLFWGLMLGVHYSMP